MNAHLSSNGVWFPNWAVVLAKVRLKDLDRRAYRLAIVGYLSFCKRARQRATVASARLFMAEVEARRRLSQSHLALWKEALNWFFTTAPGSKNLKAENTGRERRTFNVQRPTSNADHGTPCARGKASSSTAEPSRSVKKAKCRQLGHKVAWGPTSRVRRTTRRRPL